MKSFLLDLLLSALAVLSSKAATQYQVRDASPTGSFQNPPTSTRPRFRYWAPDASVNLSQVSDDIASAGAIGAAGIELLGFYDYGAQPGTFEPSDWSLYGWGTPAWKTLLDTTIQAHADNGLTLDFAMGPATGDGVPAIQGQEGLAWDLSMNTATVDASHAFNGTLPGWGSGELQGVVTGVVVGTVNVSGSQPGLPNSNSAAHQQITLSASSLQDITSMVGSDGHLTISFSSDTSTSQRLIFAVYLYHTNGTVVASPSNLLGPQTPPTNYVQNGSWIVDHFSAAGAKVVTDFWEQNLLTNGTKEALMHVGHVGWEDSVEILENIYWTEELPTKFQQQHNYSITQWYPILFHQNDYSSPSTWYITDEPDSGNSHVADYRNTLTECYGEYLSAFTEWSQSYLNLGYSAQVGYNLAVDMQTDIPLVSLPECESLAFDNLIDGYRQYTAPASLANRSVISTESDAGQSPAFSMTLPRLLWSFRRSLAGGVNNIVIHGYPYTGHYPNTTWPGFVTFTYAFTEMHSRHQPGWDFYSDAMGYIGRLQYVFQSGVSKLDLAFYQKFTAYNGIPRNYGPTDLEQAGYSYGYLNPDNFDLAGVTVEDGQLAPGLQGYKALVVQGSDAMTVDGVGRIADFAQAGLPIVFFNGTPSYLASYNASGQVYVNQTLARLSSLPNVHHVAGDLAQTLAMLDIQPLTSITSNGTWYTYWRHDEAQNIDYVFLVSDSPDGNVKTPGASQGTITFQSTGTPYRFDPWSGQESPILNYTSSANTTTIFFELAINQGIIIAFKDTEPPGLHLVNAPSSVLDVISGHGSNNLSVLVGSCDGGCGTIQTSDGRTIPLDASAPPSFPLQNWTLIVEHWDPPDPLDQPAVDAVRYNTTHQIGTLVSWQSVPDLQNVSGRGYYETSFSWPPADGALGALISFGPIVHTVRVNINGQTVPPLDTTLATADISAYLKNGTNLVQVAVSTTLGNVLGTVWTSLRTVGQAPTGVFDSALSPPPIADYGLLYPAIITPYNFVSV